jgi:hypothetical protein
MGKGIPRCRRWLVSALDADTGKRIPGTSAWLWAPTKRLARLACRQDSPALWGYPLSIVSERCFKNRKGVS